MYCFIVAGRIPSETEMSSNHNIVLSPLVRDNTSWALPLPLPIPHTNYLLAAIYSKIL